MKSDKQIKNKLDSMPPKQKLMLAATLIIILVVIWQVSSLFGGGSSSKPSPALAVHPAGGGAPAMSAGAPSAAKSAAAPAGVNAPSAGDANTAVVEASVPKDDYIEEQKKVERRYLKQLNDLEELKLQRQIEETNQAIAVAKLATFTAEKSASELLTKPAPAVPETAYANQLTNPVRPEGNGGAAQAVVPGGQPPVPATGAVAAPPEVAYTVISVSMQFNKWMAVIGAQGKLYNVSMGDVLPLDGSVVSSINKNGVVLKKDGKVKKISMTTAV